VPGLAITRSSLLETRKSVQTNARENLMKERVAVLFLFGCLICCCSCGETQDGVASKPREPGGKHYIASPRREIIEENVLAAQLAFHDEIESKTTFSSCEPIQASLYLAGSSKVEPRRISAFLLLNESVVEEQSIVLRHEDRHQFDFRFVKTPRELGSYEIRFVEIARSRGKPVLLARLFLNVE